MGKLPARYPVPQNGGMLLCLLISSMIRSESHPQHSKHFSRRWLTTVWMPQTAPNRLKARLKFIHFDVPIRHCSSDIQSKKHLVSTAVHKCEQESVGLKV